MSYCYNSPWCEPGEKCSCVEYQEFMELEEKEKAKLKVSDQTIVIGICWTIAAVIVLLVIFENIST